MRDAETGNDFFEARYYRDILGRFTSPDPLNGTPNRPQSWNRYAYVLNNPLKLIDPTGLAESLASAGGNRRYVNTFDEDTLGLGNDNFAVVAGYTGGYEYGTIAGATAGFAQESNVQTLTAHFDLREPQLIDLPGTVDVEVTALFVSLTDHSTQATSGKMRLSIEGLDFLVQHEGFSGRPYNDSGGNATIGYGHLLHLGAVNAEDRALFPHGISREEGRAFLARDLATAEGVVRSNVRVPLNQNQFDSLVSFAFNVGPGNFQRSSAIRELNARNYDAVPDRMARINTTGKDHHVDRGLVNRRADEGRLFRTPVP